jgi:uncharacterized small protein (DUF1192 family)
MSNLDEPNGTPGGDEQNTPVEKLSRAALEARVRELEKETTRLKTELNESQAARARERDLLNSLILDDLPQNDEELREFVAKSSSLSDLLREMEVKFGLESPK